MLKRLIRPRHTTRLREPFNKEVREFSFIRQTRRRSSVGQPGEQGAQRFVAGLFLQPFRVGKADVVSAPVPHACRSPRSLPQGTLGNLSLSSASRLMLRDSPQVHQQQVQL